MKVTRASRLALRLQSATFIILFFVAVGLLAWLSMRYHHQYDWTASGRHTLSPASVELLRTLPDPITITAFVREKDLNGYRKRINEMVNLYQQHKHDINLTITDPDIDPERVRALKITREGEMVVEYRSRSESLKVIGEQALTNALQRLARTSERLLVFLEGHGERDPSGNANHDLRQWVSALETKGFHATTLNLTTNPAIPDNTAVLVIAGPQARLLDGEVQIIRDYVAGGGNLLWLNEPNGNNGLETLAADLGLTTQPGTIVDATGQMLGISHPAIVVVPQYPTHVVTESLSTLTLFPFAHAISVASGDNWEVVELLRTLPRAWSETGPLEGEVSFDEHDIAGPLTLGVVMSRPHEDGEMAEDRGVEDDHGHDHGHGHDHALPGSDPHTPTQRIAVIGDGDFLTNSYLGNGANQELGNRLINWLSHDDHFITIAPRTAPDTRLELTRTSGAVIGMLFLFVIPGGLLASGIILWLRRRKR